MKETIKPGLTLEIANNANLIPDGSTEVISKGGRNQAR